MRKRLTDWLVERAKAEKQPSGIAGGPSVAHVFGWVLVMLLGVEAITGVALAAFYAPSTTDAWASVAYVQGRMPLGWLVRGLHFHGASALVIVCGVHLLQTAIYGAYKKPREVTWWLGIVLMMLVLGFAASAPGGAIVRSMAIGGNEYGNLTLTRFYALHAMALPALTTLGVAAHV